MATLYSDHPSFIQTKAAFDEMRASFKPQFETQYFIPLFTFIERGLASSVVDPWSAISYSLYNPTNPKIVFRPFSPTVLFTAAIMTPSHRPLSNIANAFAEELREEIRRISVID
jgi:DNA-binding transcriptional LysR family regulator